MFRASLRVPRQEVRIVTPNTSAQPEPPRQPGSRRGRMQADSAAVEEVPVWLEVNGEPTVTWMCTPDQLEELATGWLHGEGYIETMDDLLRMRPCATDPGFWADVKPERVAFVKRQHKKRVLASGCGAVSTFLADPPALKHAPARGAAPPRAGPAWVARPSVPSTRALTIARRAGIILVGRAVSGAPHVHRPEA